ncbi:MAG: HIT family protein [Tenericutes bacterium HGW-Tenericutes-1]|jgi:diadenosine tetraphosphate (Ap4A) HIT family hydrolase|nr:MAG: HIT family protein [Tenericutes bacterium HGW-Tenericutes-1]
MTCLFCDKIFKKEDIIYENETVVALYDQYPVSKGHVLIVPKRHIQTYFDASFTEKTDVDQAIMTLKTMLDATYHPDGYNIGINNGIASGQSIMHLHVHLIPRYVGDTLNPKGGVRGVIPGKQSY